MDDKALMEDMLMTVKGVCDLYMHGTIESGTALYISVKIISFYLELITCSKLNFTLPSSEIFRSTECQILSKIEPNYRLSELN